MPHPQTIVPATEDAALVDRLLAGDEAAFAALVDRYHHRLVHLARAFVPDSTAEEVVQDVWVAVLAGLPRFERRSSVKTWIVRILFNIAKTRGVRDKRVVHLGDARTDDVHSPERQLLEREAVDIVTRALWSLPVTQHAVVMLRDVEGLETRDVCRILGVTETNLRVLHHRARLKLRQAMHRYAA
jgi:RNA polymerase sigma-70 factor (ECF subfamily)